MTKPKSEPETPTPDDSGPSQAAGKGADGETPDDSSPPQEPGEDASAS